ncbi:retrovirus-related pol polyprotein from transposon TNT 1-94 [Tanacetum coccineum]
MCHILGIEPQFENIIKNGPFIPMTVGQRKPEGQWTRDERKDANLDQRLKSLIMSVLLNDQMNPVINRLTAKSTWDDLILYKALMDEFVNDGIKLSKLEINIGFINGLPEKWLSFCQILRNINHVRDSKIASLFGKLKYEENLIDSIYETEKNKSLVSATPLLTAFFSSSIDEEEVSSYDNEIVEVKVLMALAEENDAISKEGARNGEWVKISMRKCINEQIPSQKKRILGVNQLIEDPSSSGQKDLVFVKSLANDTKVSIPGVERPWLSEAEGFIFPNHDTGRILPVESQKNTTDPPVAVTKSSATDYDSTNESLVCSTLLPPLKKLDGAEPVSGPKTIKSILRSKFTFKAKTLKGVIINKPSSAPAKVNKSSSASNVNSAPAGKIKSVKIEDDPPLAIINPRNPQHTFKRCEACGHSTHTTTDHYDIEWFRRGEALQAKKAEALKPTRVELSNANRSKTPTKIDKPDLKWCLEMTLHAQLKVMALSNVMFDEKRGTIFNSNKEVVMIAPRVRDVYVLDMNLCTKNLVSLPKSLTISLALHKDWPASKQNIHLLSRNVFILFHMDLFGPVTPRSINHEKYTLVIIDEYSRSDNGTEFRNSILVNFYDEKGISQNFSSPYTPEQNGVAERKNKTLIKAARTMLLGNDVSFIESYESPKPVVLETEVSSKQNGQTDQNDQTAQTDEILNDNLSEHSNHNNDEKIIDNLPNTKHIHISEHSSSPNDKHIELVNIIGNPRARMLTRSMTKQLSAASAHECLFVDFLYEKEPKMVSKELKHPGWVDAMQDELN